MAHSLSFPSSLTRTSDPVFSKESVDALTVYLNQTQASKNVFVPRSTLLVNMRGGVESLRLNAAGIFKSKPKYIADGSEPKKSSLSFFRRRQQEPNLPLDDTKSRTIERMTISRSNYGLNIPREDQNKFAWALRHYPQIYDFFTNSKGNKQDHAENLVDILEDSDTQIDPESHDGSIRLKTLSDDLNSFLKDAQVEDVKTILKEYGSFFEDHDIQKDIASALAKGKIDGLRKNEEYTTAVFSHVNQEFGIETDNGYARKLIGQLLKNKPDNLELPEDGASVILKVRDSKKFKESYEKVIKHFRVATRIPVQGKNQSEPELKHIKESHAYSFLESLITEGTEDAQALDRVDPRDGLSTRDCLDEFLNSAVCVFESSDKNLEQFLNHELTHNQKDLKAGLTATQALSLHYAEQVELKEVMGSLSLGALIGGGGEVAIEHLLHDLSPGAKTGLRMMLFAIVDFIDNSLGELGTLNADLTGMGLKLSKKDIFNIEGSLTILQKLVKYPGMFLDLVIKGDAPGPAGLPVGIAVRSASAAALIGIALNYWPATVYTNPHAHLAELMGATILSVGGTSLSIPLNLLFTFPRSLATVLDHIHQGRIMLPPDVQDLIDTALEDKRDSDNAPADMDLKQKAEDSFIAAEKAGMKFAYGQALKDLTARIGFSASIRAFSSIGVLALLWPLVKAGAPREVIQPIVMAVSPAMENLCRFFYTSITAYRFPSKVNNISHAILDAATQGTKITPTKLMHMATGTPTRYLTRLWEGMTYPAQLALTVRNKVYSPMRQYPIVEADPDPIPVQASKYMTGVETIVSKGWGYMSGRKSESAEKV